MKKKYLCAFATAIIISCTTCVGQPLVRSLKDISKLKTNQVKYVGKPLTVLLKDIGLPIATALASQRKDTLDPMGHFYFQFQNRVARDSIIKSGGNPAGLVVYVKELFTIDMKAKYYCTENCWTIEDERRYGHLTVERIRVFTGKKHD